MKHSLSFRTSPASNHGRGIPLTRRAECTSTTPYISPKAQDQLDVMEPVTVTWDPNCAASLPNAIDLYLYAVTPNEGSKLVHGWNRVNFWHGELEVNIDPRWYNSTETMDLQFLLVDPSFPLAFNNIPQGPIFTANYNRAAASSLFASGAPGARPTESVSQFEVVDNFFKSTGMTKGQIAAAVIMPILAVAAFITAYVIYTRRKEATKRKQYREKVDQRMSVAPGADWAPISAVGAAAAIRQSMAFSAAERNTRASSYFGDVPMPEMPRPRLTSNHSSNDRNSMRMSRISFAPDIRPSSEHRPAVPPLPMNLRKSSVEDHGSPDQSHLSPIQREGAFVLDDESIRDRLSAASANNTRPSVDEELGRDLHALPAVAMMRATEQPGNEVAAPRTILDEPITPLDPALVRESSSENYRTYSIGAYSGSTNSMIDGSNTPSYFSNTPSATQDPDEALRVYATRNAPAATASPFSGFAAGPGLAAAAGLDMSSPDAILRAYAATRPAAPATVVTSSTTSPVRTLYNPTMTQGLNLNGTSAGNRNPYRDSAAPSSYYGSEGDGKVA